ncbi:hypothetical protein BJV78DRAFT_1129966 [Lactifluus subvellereus]|nr:hypothetical protein BJV78DRAFT_1129966 [Lactifluus subvellereus]
MAMLPQPPSSNKHLASLESLPLFMSSLPDNPADNVALSALQSLAHDGTPDELAQNFKEQGNEYFRGKRYREALGFYTQGVEAKADDGQLREALLLNRAACNLELQNYGSVLRDCAAVIATNTHAPSKAYYRAGLALLALDRPDEALDVCACAGEAAADDVGFKTLRARAEEKRAEMARKVEERRERTQHMVEEKRRMDVAFAERNLLNVLNAEGSNAIRPYGAAKFDPEDPTGGTLILPVLFLYPEYATSDVISDFVEDTSFAAILAVIFPPGAPRPQWDVEGKYVDGSLVVYAMTKRKRLLKVGRKMTLRDVCRAAGSGSGAVGPDGSKDGLEVKDGCLSFVVLPKGEAEQKWVKEMRQ